MAREVTSNPRGDGHRIDAANGGFEAVLHTELAAVAPLWRRLQAEGACTAYQRIEWVEGLVRHLASARRAEPLFVEVRAAGRPVMLLALARVRRRGYRAIEALDFGACDYAAPVLAPGFEAGPAEAQRIWRAVRAVLPTADLVRITRIPASIQGVTNPLTLLTGAKTIRLTHSGFALEGEPDGLLKRVCRPSTHQDIVRRGKRLDRHAGVRFVAAREPAEIGEIVDVMIAQRRERFREMGRYEPLDEPAMAAFYRDAALRPGPTRVFGLKAEGAWIATSYGLVHGGAFHGVLLAMAGEAWRPVAPGIVIASRIMVWAREQGLDYFDFTIGAQPYKTGFRPVERPLFELAEALTLRGHLIAGLDRFTAAGRATLDRHPGLVERLRAGVRFLRRRRKERNP